MKANIQKNCGANTIIKENKKYKYHIVKKRLYFWAKKSLVTKKALLQ